MAAPSRGRTGGTGGASRFFARCTQTKEVRDFDEQAARRRRFDHEAIEQISSGLEPPILDAVKVLLIPAALTVLAVQWRWLGGVLGTVPLSADQWIAVLGWSLVLPAVVELYKLVRRNVAPAKPRTDGGLQNVLPERVLATTGESSERI